MGIDQTTDQTLILKYKKTFLSLKMKNQIFSGLALFTGVNAQRINPQMLEKLPEGERRYYQLAAMMSHYNPDFDERKYWTYGCQCLMLGDRPMSDPGLGPPVDQLDAVCKAYKDCLKCARMEYGEECIGEFHAYKYKLTKKNGAKCLNDPKDGGEAPCKRKLCECDKLFAETHVAAKDVFDDKYHYFWGTEGWDAQESCPRAGNAPVTPQCCGAPIKPSKLYNAEKKSCCRDGSIAPKGECPKSKPQY